ncbi:retrovirus-related pol polyprotein from transposon TNT 1-94 [Tanacetum coccineum]
MKVEESLNVTFYETPPPPKTLPLEDDDLVEEKAIEVNKTRPLGNDLEDKSLENNEIINIKESKSHPLDIVIVHNPMDMTIIGTKWVYRNKLDENGVVTRNKARLESIRILLSYACALNFKLFQMDVKSAFHNGFINEEVYVAQPPGFIDFAKPNHVYRLKKALYGLKQDPKAWPMKTPMSTEMKLTKDEEGESVDNTKYRGIIGSLLYLTASRPDIMFSVCLCTRFQEDPKTFHLEAVKRIFRYVKGTTYLRLWYPKRSGIETIVYADSDHAGDYVDQKSTSGIFTFMGCCLTSWFSKKQTALSISSTKAEYVKKGSANCLDIEDGIKHIRKNLYKYPNNYLLRQYEENICSRDCCSKRKWARPPKLQPRILETPIIGGCTYFVPALLYGKDNGLIVGFHEELWKSLFASGNKLLLDIGVSCMVDSENEAHYILCRTYTPVKEYNATRTNDSVISLRFVVTRDEGKY